MLRRLFAHLPNVLQRGLKRNLDGRAIRNRFQSARRQLDRSAEDLSTAGLSGVAAREDWDRCRATSRRQLLSMLALDPLPEKTPLNAKITGGWERPAYRVEKLVFESIPGLYVVGNFYLPKDCSRPVPCVVYLNGHWASLEGSKTGFQDRYLWYPSHGFALLVLDPIGYGEISGVHPGMSRLNQWHWLSLGYTPAGVEVWNAMRALDWLATRPEVDSARIGVTGISGGGVMTQFLAALDDRVAVAAPSCSTYTIGTQAAMGLVPRQCDCTFYPNVFQMDFPEVLALIAPRPLLILGGRRDAIFPPAGFREAFRRANQIYGLFGDCDHSGPRIRLVESGQGHTDPPHSLHETRQWMCRWLMKTAVPASVVAEPGPNPERPEVLRCTESVPPGALNHRIQDVWVQVPARKLLASREEWDRRKEELLRSLRTRIFGWFPKTEIPFKTRAFPTSGGRAGDFADFREYEFDSEPGVPVKACLLTPKGIQKSMPLVVWVRSPAEPVLFPDIDEFLPLLRTHALVILTPRFSEKPLAGHEYAEIERTAALSGRSVAALRTWDVLRTVAWAVRDRGIEPSEIAVYGRGEAGIAGLYAAVFDSAIGHVVMRDPPFSHFEGAALPMILRETDIDEVAGMLAPRRLSVLSRRRDGFSATRSSYDLIGSPSAFGYAASLTDALLGKQTRDEGPC